MFHGTIDAAEVHPRGVVKQARRLNAAAVIVSHNHPSGNPEPSAADKALTSQLRQALALVNVRPLDPIISAGSRTPSFAEPGLLCPWGLRPLFSSPQRRTPGPPLRAGLKAGVLGASPWANSLGDRKRGGWGKG